MAFFHKCDLSLKLIWLKFNFFPSTDLALKNLGAILAFPCFRNKLPRMTHYQYNYDRRILQHHCIMLTHIITQDSLNSNCVWEEVSHFLHNRGFAWWHHVTSYHAHRWYHCTPCPIENVLVLLTAWSIFCCSTSARLHRASKLQE